MSLVSGLIILLYLSYQFYNVHNRKAALDTVTKVLDLNLSPPVRMSASLFDFAYYLKYPDDDPHASDIEWDIDEYLFVWVNIQEAYWGS